MTQYRDCRGPIQEKLCTPLHTILQAQVLVDLGIINRYINIHVYYIKFI